MTTGRAVVALVRIDERCARVPRPGPPPGRLARRLVEHFHEPGGASSVTNRVNRANRRILLGAAAVAAAVVPMLVTSPAAASAAGRAPSTVVAPACTDTMIEGIRGSDSITNLYGAGQAGVQSGVLHNGTGATITGVVFDLQVFPNPAAGPLPSASWRVDAGSWHKLHLRAVAPSVPGDLTAWKSDNAQLGVALAPSVSHTLSIQLTFAAGSPATFASALVDFGSAGCGSGAFVTGTMPLWGWALDVSGSSGGGTLPSQPYGTQTAATAGRSAAGAASSASSAPVSGAPSASGSVGDGAQLQDPAASAPSTPMSGVGLSLTGSSSSHASALPYILVVLALVLGAGGWVFHRRWGR
jgi:hypothetical protein